MNRFNVNRILSVLLCFFWFFITGCNCNGKSSSCSHCPCTPDDVVVRAAPVLVSTIQNMKNQQQIFSSANTLKKDTLYFQELTYTIDTSKGRCHRPRQTCCDRELWDNYELPVYHGSQKLSNAAISLFDGGYLETIYGNTFYARDGLKAVRFQGITFDDVMVKTLKDSIKNQYDTVGLLSVTKGLLLYTDSRKKVWKRKF